MGLKFNKGDVVKFERNVSVKQERTVVWAVVERRDKNVPQQYVIEFEEGWIPEGKRLEKYKLNQNKTYLFATESELVLIDRK